MAKSHSKQPEVHKALLKALPFIQFTLPTDGFRPTLHCQDIFAGGKLLTPIIKKEKKKNLLSTKCATFKLQHVVFIHDGTRLHSPSNPAAAELSSDCARGTTGKVARQFQESPLHLQQELWPVLEGEGRADKSLQEEREEKAAERAKGTGPCRALVLTGRSVSSQPYPFTNSKHPDQIRAALCGCSHCFKQHSAVEENFLGVLLTGTKMRQQTGEHLGDIKTQGRTSNKHGDLESNGLSCQSLQTEKLKLHFVLQTVQ